MINFMRLDDSICVFFMDHLLNALVGEGLVGFKESESALVEIWVNIEGIFLGISKG